MPIPAIIPPLIAAGTGIATMIGNNKAQKKRNEEQMAFSREMYGRQRKDAIADFHMMNEYNHPLQQMNRMRQAGLNPNLFYGKGAESTASTIRSANPPNANLIAPQYDIEQAMSPITRYLSARNVQAQTDKLNEQAALTKRQGMLTEAQTAKTLTDNARSKFDLKQAEELNQDVILRAKLENDELEIRNFVTLSKNDREELANSANVSRTLQDILNKKMSLAKDRTEIERLKVMIENAKKEGQLKDLDIKLREEGIMPSDPLWARYMTQFLKGDGTSLLETLKEKYPVPDTPQKKNSSLDWLFGEY